MKNGPLLKNLYAAVFFSVLIVFFFPAAFVGNKILISRMGDAHLYDYCNAVFFKTACLRGYFPFWNPLAVCGLPFGADASSILALFPLVGCLLRDVNSAWNLTIFLKVFFAGFCTFLYLKRLGLRFAAGLMGGVIMAFFFDSGASFNQMDSWVFTLPLTLWLMESFYAEKKARYVVLAFFVFAAFFLNAVPQHFIYFGAFFSAYTLIRFRSPLGVCVMMLAAGAISFHLFRVYELLLNSSRPQLWVVNVLLPTHLFHFIFPYLLNTVFHPEMEFFLHRIFGWLTPILFHIKNIRCYFPPYVGVLGLAFVLLAWRKREPARFYLGTLAVLFFYTMTYPFFTQIYNVIPILSQLPHIGRINPLFTFVLAVLAAIGLDAVSGQRRNFALKGICLFYAAVTAFVVGGLCLIRFIFLQYGETVWKVLAEHIRNNIIGAPGHTASPDFYYKRIDEFFVFVNQWTDLRSPAILVPVLLMLATLALLFLWRNGKIRSAVFLGGCLLLLFSDAYIYYHPLPRPDGASREDLVSHSKMIQFLEKDAKKEAFRVAPILEDVGHGVARPRNILTPGLNMLYGLAGVETYTPLVPKNYTLLVRNFQARWDENADLVELGTEGNFDYALADLLNIKYFTTRKGQRLERVMPVAYEDGTNVLYLNPTYYPRAFLVTDHSVSRDPKAVLSLLKERKADLRHFAVVGEKPVWDLTVVSEPAKEDNAEIESYTPDRVRVKVAAAQNCLLILLDNYFPGWHATVDGEPVKLLQADLSFRAVAVTRGVHTVDFFYRPESFRNGLYLSVFFMLLGLLAMRFWMAKKRIGF